MTKYLIYKITNHINGKIYVGAHQSPNENDGYMSSSQLVKYAIAKYGVENFSKSVLHILDSRLEMFDKEREIVNEEFVKRKDTYNIKLGGTGGWEHWNDGSERCGLLTVL